MKKILSAFLIFLMSFLFVSCNNVKNVTKEITYDDLYEANTFSNIFEKYDSISYALTNTFDDEESYTLYASKDAFIIDRKKYVRMTYNDNDYYYDKESKEFYQIFNATDNSFRENHGDWCIIYRKKGDETVTYFKENKETYSMLITLTGETAEKEISYLTNRKLISNEDIVYDIVVDKESMLVKEFSEYIINELTEKKTKCAKVSNIEYNPSEPKYIEMAKKLEEKMINLKESQVRYVTVVRNPDTKDEKTFVFKTIKGETNKLLVGRTDEENEGIDYECYSNRECTIPYSFDLNTLYNDITIYLKEKK